MCGVKRLSCCRAKLIISQSGPKFGPGSGHFQVKVIQVFRLEEVLERQLQFQLVHNLLQGQTKLVQV